jgi:dCMP deaminase
MPRIPIDKIYMQIAYQVAKLSYAERRTVGCVIVKDEQIVSFGYNGTPHGFDNDCECEVKMDPDAGAWLDPETIEKQWPHESSEGDRYKLETKREVLHAESNALMKLAKSTMSCKDSILYTTTAPCFDCAKLIIQAGVKEVFYCEDYRDMSGIMLLQRAGIEVNQVIVWNND